MGAAELLFPIPHAEQQAITRVTALTLFIFFLSGTGAVSSGSVAWCGPPFQSV
jgi:hypothetical protein